MRTITYYFHILLIVLNLLYDLTNKINVSAQSTKGNNTSPDRLRTGIAEGGVLPQNTTSFKTSTDDIHGLLTNHSIPIQKTNNSHTVEDIGKSLKNPDDSKQIEVPVTLEKTKTNADQTVVNSSVIPIQNTTKVAQIKHVPTKPQITEHDDPNQIEIQLPSHVPEIPNVDALKKRNERANYIIPIVGVIFSVPLVAIIISVVYKRGADWWQHRNYRRMDFLIEGMYNN